MPAPDSVQVHRAAQAAQARFERRRVALLPFQDGSSWDPCDETIGRYCFRYGDRQTIYEPPPDSEPLIRYREQLLDELSHAARALPGDAWIAGQRVRYLVEAKRANDAEAAAADCRASTWWCLALAGYAQHDQGRYASADSAYARALNAMPPEERCRWNDLTLLLDGSPSPSGYRQQTCEARDSLERRFWWLADPLYLIPGNERRTEHYSRWVMNRLQEGAVSPWGHSWGNDHREMLIRFGWPAAWSRRRPSGYRLEEDWAFGAGFREPQRAYEPPSRYVEQPAGIVAGRWTLAPDQPRGGYVPSYAARVDTLANQVAVFRRAGHGVVVAGYDLTRDSVTAETAVRSALFVSPGPDGQQRMTVNNHGRARDVLEVETPAAGGLLSLEALAPDARRAGRQRYWISLPPLPAGRVAVSDVLLLSGADSLPHELEDAAPLARSSTVVPAAVAGLYWEVYGLGPASVPYAVGLTVVRESIGLVRRAARALGLGGERPQVRLGWSEVSRPGTGITGSSLALDLTSARPGRYTIRLSVAARGDSAVTERVLTITPR